MNTRIFTHSENTASENFTLSEIFSERLRRAIRESGLTQTAVAEITGLSSAYISELKSGNRTNPSREIIGRLAEALGKSDQWFFAEREEHADPLPARKRAPVTYAETPSRRRPARVNEPHVEGDDGFRRLITHVGEECLNDLAQGAFQEADHDLYGFAQAILDELRARKSGLGPRKP